MQEYTNKLLDKLLNFVNEMIFSIVDNEVYYLKEILKQKDKSEFIKAMVKEIDIHERRNHWELYL